MVRIVLAAVILLAFALQGSAGDESVWPGGARCAVSLTYDDSVPIHHQAVAPLLERHGLAATFYLTAKSIDDAEAWKRVASRGHELGNHSLFHPCRRQPPEKFAWLEPHYDLQDYTPGRFREELRVANLLLDQLDGGKPRSYGNNCTNVTIGRGASEQAMDPILDDLFVASRGALTSEIVDPANPVFTRLGHFNGDDKTFEELKAEIEQAREQGGWIIYMFHGVGAGTHALYIDEEEHRRLVEWLDEERSTIWTAPVVDVALRVKR